MKLQVADWPAPATLVGLTVLTSVIAGAGVGAGTVTVDGGEVTGPPAGGVPVAVAVSLTWPLSRSACVTVYVAVHVAEAPGASVVVGHEIADMFAGKLGVV